MQKKYIVRLTLEECDHLHTVIKNSKGGSQKVRRAQILLKADADGPCWTDRQISEAFCCRTKTVENIRLQFVLNGFRQLIDGKKRKDSPAPKLSDGEREAGIIATRLGHPPPGYANRTLRLSAHQAVELELVSSISHETVRQTLKKMA
ncbi:hypothetical protein QUF90_05680 [Desulfococcaceae bacterium HSG9]|nr:hypothetical protein [Desulfococcaceae bacterium HSG9]